MTDTSDIIELYLNSQTADSFPSGYTSDATFHMPTIEIAKDEKAYISVKNAVFSYSWYNVNYTNNILNYQVNNIPYSITFPQGNYNANTFLIMILNLLKNQTYPNGNYSMFTIAYDVKTNKYNFGHLYYEFGFYKTSTCFELLGFSSNTDKISASKVLVSNIMINLFPIRQIYITSNNFILNNISHSDNSNANVITSLNIGTNPYSIINFTETNNNQHLIHNLSNITNLNIKITDQDFDLIDFNGVHWSLTLVLLIKKV
jgi:hypothetical protein